MSSPDDINLREVARLFNLWNEHGWTTTDERALSAWVHESAARTRAVPHFHAAWDLVNELQLVSAAGDGLLKPTDAVRKSFQLAPRALDGFNADAAWLVFSELMTVRKFAECLERLLACIKFAPSSTQFRWAEIPAASRTETAWLWLQQLGLAENDGEIVMIDARLLPFILDSEPIHRPMSQHELNNRLKAQCEMADKAEDYIVEWERNRLRKAGHDDLAEGVFRISIDDVTAGFDVMSFEVDGRSKRIEVKASAGPRRRFFISRNELECAVECGDSYWLAWLFYGERLPDGDVQVAWFQNPAVLLADPAGPWELRPEKYVVERIKDDTAEMWFPVKT